MHQQPIGRGGSGVSEHEALLIAQSELDNLNLITDLVASEELDVDFWRGHLCKGTPFPPSSQFCADAP